MEVSLRGQAAARSRRRLLTIASLLLLTLMIVTAAEVFDLLAPGSGQSDLYNPERKALIEADWQLSQLVPHGPASDLQGAPIHRHIETVLDWLDRAEGVQSDHRQQITELRAKVRALEAADRTARASAAQRDQLYDEINHNLKALIDRYGDTSTPR